MSDGYRWPQWHLGWEATLPGNIPIRLPSSHGIPGRETFGISR